MDLHKILFSTRKTAIVQKLYRISKRDIGSSLRDRKPYGVVYLFIIYLFIYYIIVHEVQNTHIQRKI